MTVDKINIIKGKLKAAQDRQKSYSDQHRREIEYQVGDKVFLWVSPWKGIMRFGNKGKLRGILNLMKSLKGLDH